jgi:hypothetical protein
LIGTRIVTLRAPRVMLDDDLAELYGVSTKALGAGGQAQSHALSRGFHVQALCRGVHRFEVTNCDLKHGTRRTAPYAFTEQGVAMLHSVSGSQRAIAVDAPQAGSAG